MSFDPIPPAKRHPIDVVPPTTSGSPTEMSHPAFTKDVPFWRPGWGDILKHMGWRWLLLLPGVAVLGIFAVVPWQPALLQFLLLGGGKLAIIFVGGALGIAGAGVRSAVHQRKDPFCIHCGYDLIGLPDHHTCPECGRPFSLRLIEEYRRDPQWFIKRYKARGEMPVADAPFAAGAVRSRKSRDGT
jgi:hypothetical protein